MTSFNYFLLFLASGSVTLFTAAQSYVAEGYFVIDNKVSLNYREDKKISKPEKELQNDMDYILTQVNELFKSLVPHGITLEIRVKRFNILPVDIFPKNSTKSSSPFDIQPKVSIKLFEKWLLATNSYKNISYDFAFLWTGFNLADDDKAKTAGFSETSQMCDSVKSIGIAEFSRTYYTAISTAHEIAHILGAHHCKPNSLHIMSPVTNLTSPRKWSFDKCSALEIKKYLGTLKTNCLLKTDKNSSKPDVTYASYKGQIFDPDIICHREKGHRSYMCKMWNFYNDSAPGGDLICSRLQCSEPGTELCVDIFAPNGMVCAVGKRCNAGKCTPDSSVKSKVDPQCLYGDQKVAKAPAKKLDSTCEELIRKLGPASCYKPVYFQQCCSTCARRRINRPGCEYGDRVSICKMFKKNVLCEKEDNTKKCCNSCYGYKPKRSVADNFDSLFSITELSLP